MKLEFIRLTLGPLPNNVYLLGDKVRGDAVVIDPSFDSQVVLAHAEKMGWTLRQVWLTHGHFDHIAGAGMIASAFNPALPVGMHPADLAWYQIEGGAGKFGLSISQPPPLSILFEPGMQLSLTAGQLPAAHVLFAPGHSPGHVMFYCEPLGVLFCGDVIFRDGIGRADLDGGDWRTLLANIHEQVLTLPDETRLLSGHGPESTVGYERENNPFLRG